MSEFIPDPANHDPELRDAIRAIRMRWRRRRILEGIVALVAAALVALLAGLALRFAAGSTPAITVLMRGAGYLLLLAAAVWYLVHPVVQRASDEQVALYLEEQAPELRQLVLSAVHELHPSAVPGSSPALRRRLMERALEDIHRLEHGAAIESPKARAAVRRLAALTVAGALLLVFGPASVREVARVLFVPWSRAAAATVPALTVSPGNAIIPRNAALDVRAQLHALIDHGATIVARADSADAWTRIPMVHDSTGAGYIARMFDVNRSTVYYVEAGGIRSPQYRVTVTDLPTVKRLTLELRYPAYTGLAPERIENGGDVVAVTGTTAMLSIASTLPVTAGSLHFDNGITVPLTLGGTGELTGSFTVAHDGFYRIDLVASDGTRVPGSVQHSVEALVDHPPTIRIDRPGRDTRVTSIEEVPVSMRASDDYGVRAVALHYTVNGGTDQVLTLTDSTHRDRVDFSTIHTLFLEEMSLHVGDLVAYHATARDGAGHTTSSDIYFMEVRPFGHDYHSADDNGGGAGGGGGNNPGQFTQRQRELIAGTFNWQRDSARTSDGDRRANATTLAIAQGKLHQDVAEKAAEMAARGAVNDDSEFVLVQSELDSAARAMQPAEDGVGRRAMNDAIPAQEHALQHLQAADDAYRDITVRRNNGGGGGGGGGGGASNAQDLADLFELQTDKLKNQYEMPRADPSTPVQQALDSTAEKLKELAARQVQENARQQEMANALQQRMGQQSNGGAGGAGGSGGAAGRQQSGGVAGGTSRTPQQPDDRQQGQQLTRSASGGATGSAQRELARQVDEQARQLDKLSRDQNSAELADAARKLQQAADAMRQAAAGASPEGTAALDRLREASQNVASAAVSAQGQAIQDLAHRAGDLAGAQRGIAKDVAGLQALSPAERAQREASLDSRNDALTNAVQQLGVDAERVARQTRGDQPRAGAAAQTAADEIRDRQVPDLIGASKRIMREGSADYTGSLEGVISQALDSVASHLATAAGSIVAPVGQQQALALDRTRDLVNGLESLRDRATGARGDAASGNDAGASGSPPPGSRTPGAAGEGVGAAQQGQSGRAGLLGRGDWRQFQHEVGARRQAAESLRTGLAVHGVDVAPLDRVIADLDRLQLTTNPGRADQLQAAIVTGLKNFEFTLWRKFNGDLSNRPALGAAAQVPPEYRALVAEYYRALARKGPN